VKVRENREIERVRNLALEKESVRVTEREKERKERA
jgi:hypothetical protein